MAWVRKLEPRDLELAAEWLSNERNYAWLDFGGGVQQLVAPRVSGDVAA